MRQADRRRGCVIVTGAGSGIGRATAVALLDGGWDVVALDRDQASLSSLQQGGRDGTSLVLRAVDIACIDEVKRVVDEITQPIRGLVCCAAKGDNTRFIDLPVESLRTVHDINFFANFALCQLAARRMVSSGGGSIVNISSVSGLRANAGRAAYGSSKAALEMLSKIMAVELAPAGIRVNTLAPGPTLTAMATALHRGAEKQRLLGAVPAGRYATPEEIAQGVVYLLDDERSSFVTGHTLCVDGGMYAAGSFDSALNAA